jgi:hypothetical protein
MNIALAIWVTGMLSLVPYGTYYLFFHAQQDQYAFLIIGVLFWIFGYWGVAGPLLAALKIRKVFHAIEHARTQSELQETLRARETREVAVELIAAENRIPRFIAAGVYRLLIARLPASDDTPENNRNK